MCPAELHCRTTEQQLKNRLTARPVCSFLIQRIITLGQSTLNSYYEHSAQRTVKEAQTLAEQVTARFTSIDAVVAVRVYQLFEVLVLLYQCLRVLRCVAEMHIVVSHAVTQQQIAAQLTCTRYRAVVIARRVLLRRTHETLCVNRVIVTPRRWRSNGNATTEHTTALAHRHQRVETSK